MPSPRLLLAVPDNSNVTETVRRWLPEVPAVYPAELGPPPWPTVEAAIVGQLDRVLPNLRPEDLPQLAFVQHLFTGVDGFPVERFRPEVQVAGNVGAFAPFVAEHAVALVLALAKRIVPAHRQVIDGRLRPTDPSLSLDGRRALILGFGEIGHETARRLRPFGVRIVGLSRSGRPDPAADETLPDAALEEAIATADIVVNCLPLSGSTRGIIGSRELGRLRPDAIFVNVGRAGTVDEHAFWAFLEARPGQRVGIDVWWDEDFDHGKIGRIEDLHRFPNVVGTPHSAGVTSASRQRALDKAFENLARFFGGSGPLHLVPRADILAQAEPA